MKIFVSIILMIAINSSYAQTASYDFYNVTPVVGNGMRLWGSDLYKIHFGNTSEYLYGPVTDYSIKMNMSSQAGRGWVWGIAGSTPVAALDNQGNMQIAGKIGLGINPSSKLDVSDGNSNLSILTLRNSAWACNQRTSIEFWNGGNKNYPTSRVVSQMDGCGTGGEALVFETQTAGQTTPSSKVIIKNNGYVGIGSLNPDALLAVKGQIQANEVKVDISVPGPDYVFEKEYKLSSLEDIKTYIDQNKHLPEVPSAKEMEKNGVLLGEMNILLLKKIEELTLYVIELKKRDEA